VSELMLRAPAPAVTPAEAGWRWLSYWSKRVRGIAGFDTGPDEVCLVNLGGTLTATADGEHHSLGDRSSPFADLPRSLYVPPGTACTVEGDGLVGVCAARADDGHPVRPIPPEQVRVEVRGSGNATRQINHIIPPEFPAHRLLVVEVLTPGGNWSSYPPHKHDQRRDGEAVLEEIYYFEIGGHRRSPGFGFHGVYTADGEIDLTVTVRDRDVVLIPRGYHGPSVAAPGYPMYYLNVLAGPAEERSMAFSDDPAHAWVRSSWAGQPMDGRLPLCTAEGTSRDAIAMT
jgi:5-deoxy-glucuronate isomerase